MSKKDFDACEFCCVWVNDKNGKSPHTVKDEYPVMMREVLVNLFGMKRKGAKFFIENACYGNWERLHETAIEKCADAEDYAELLLSEVWYCSDLWTWDRVMRVQWLYQRLVERCRRESAE